MLKINSYLITQQTTGRIYLGIAAFQDFIVSLLSKHSYEDFARVYLDRKVQLKKKLFEQRLMFHQGPISDNKFVFVDAVQFWWCKKQDPLRKISALQTKLELAGSLNNKQNLAEHLAYRELASWKTFFGVRIAYIVVLQISSGGALHSGCDHCVTL